MLLLAHFQQPSAHLVLHSCIHTPPFMVQRSLYAHIRYITSSPALRISDAETFKSLELFCVAFQV